MAQWQYSMFSAELNRNVDFDEELRKILEDYGMKGWNWCRCCNHQMMPATIWSLRPKGRYIRVSNWQSTNAGGAARNCTEVFMCHTRVAQVWRWLPV